jgi:hypothetical protein
VSFNAITPCVASQRVFILLVDFVIDSVRKLLDIPSYMATLSSNASLRLYDIVETSGAIFEVFNSESDTSRGLLFCDTV